MKNSGPVPMLIGGVLVVALGCTLMVKFGWLIWVPILSALVVFYQINCVLRN